MKKSLVGICCSFGLWSLVYINLKEKLQKKIMREKKNAELNYVLYQTMNSWIILMQNGKSITDFFSENCFFDIAIYGMGNMGERLYDALEGTDIHVRYGIDKNKENIYTSLPIHKPDDEMERVDAIVVTAIYYFSEIEKELHKKIDCPIISIDEVIEKSLRK